MRPAPGLLKLSAMEGVVSLSAVREDRFWGVVAAIGRQRRVAAVFVSREAALADRAWREQQVRDYAGFLRSFRQPTPIYTVETVRRADLPKSWRPLPALGFLRGQFV